MQGHRDAFTPRHMALADLAARVEDLDPGRGVEVIAHTRGARVALTALPHAAPGIFRRLILLAAAETRRPARRPCQPGGAEGRSDQPHHPRK